jgi:antitoxin HigA-1
MTIPNRVKREIPPKHPGAVLREDFMLDYGFTTASLADALGVSRQTINEILRERRVIIPIMALGLSSLYGNFPEFWLNAQNAYGLWESEHHFEKELKQIHPLDVLSILD